MNKTDLAFIAEIDGRFPDKNIAVNFDRYLGMAKSDRFDAAWNDAQTLERSGYVRRGVPADARQSVQDHSHFVNKLARAFAPVAIDRNIAGLMGAIHDIPEVMAGDFTPHDPISKPEKSRIEDLAARVIFKPKEYNLWRDHEDRVDQTAVWVADCDLLEMPLHIVNVIEQKHPRFEGVMSEFFETVEKRLETSNGRTVFAALQQSRQERRRTGKALGLHFAEADCLPGEDFTPHEVKSAEITRMIRELGL